MSGYLSNKNKSNCYGCEACVQICPAQAMYMMEDEEGFRYPNVDVDLCVNCNLCHKICPYENPPEFYNENRMVFGGYSLDEKVRFESTSGGAFSAIVEAYCDKDYVIFGAETRGLQVFHSYITDKRELAKFRKSKYSQSQMGKSYHEVKKFLNAGKKVLFSGTPCQIAGLKAYLGNINQDRLLTIEVICEGVPSPLYIRKFGDYIKRKYHALLQSIDYRYKGVPLFGKGRWDFEIFKIKASKPLRGGAKGKWDFQVMRVMMKKKNKTIILEKDRWFNPFWSVWLQHLMSRPSCYECQFAKKERLADITLGDLWGVHLYCPELYGKNGGSSLIIANTNKGQKVVLKASKKMYGHELNFEDALKYQGPMRKHISMNPDRTAFMSDLQGSMTYEDINKKWAKNPTLKLLWQKYVWGNRQKVWLWNLTHRSKKRV